MQLDWQQGLGLLAGGLIAASFIPQTWRLFKLKSAREISLLFTCLQLGGGLLFLAYGLILSLPAIVITNIVNTVLVSLVIYAKLRYGR